MHVFACSALFRVYGGSGERSSSGAGYNKDTGSEAASISESLSDDEASLSATTPGDEEEHLQDFAAPSTPDILDQVSSSVFCSS